MITVIIHCLTFVIFLGLFDITLKYCGYIVFPTSEQFIIYCAIQILVIAYLMKLQNIFSVIRK